MAESKLTITGSFLSLNAFISIIDITIILSFCFEYFSFSGLMIVSVALNWCIALGNFKLFIFYMFLFVLITYDL